MIIFLKQSLKWLKMPLRSVKEGYIRTQVGWVPVHVRSGKQRRVMEPCRMCPSWHSKSTLLPTCTQAHRKTFCEMILCYVRVALTINLWNGYPNTRLPYFCFHFQIQVLSDILVIAGNLRFSDRKSGPITWFTTDPVFGEKDHFYSFSKHLGIQKLQKCIQMFKYFANYNMIA